MITDRTKYMHFRKNGFTLLEVMLATVILSFGIAFIYQSFFTSLNGTVYVCNRLNASLELSNKIWEIQDKIRHGGVYNLQKGGQVSLNNRTYNWQALYEPLDTNYNFYNVLIKFWWLQNNRQKGISRSVYVIG